MNNLKENIEHLISMAATAYEEDMAQLIHKMDSTIKAQEAEIKRLRRALEFYAEKDNWKQVPDGVNSLDMTEFPLSIVDYDGGKIAQAALNKGE